MSWTTHDAASYPIDIARRFIRENWDDDRELDESTFSGEWRGRSFLGRFMLVDGVNWYSLTTGPHRSDPWTISRID